MEKFSQDTFSQEKKAFSDSIQELSKDFSQEDRLIETFRFLRNKKGMTAGDSLEFLEWYFKVKFNHAQVCEIIRKSGFGVDLF